MTHTRKATADQPRIAGLIVAAGMSSRMGHFKPLLDFGGQPMIAATIANLRAAGAEEICVVVGNRKDELLPLLHALNVRVVENPDFATTQMFDSVRLGLADLCGRADVVLFSPVDAPLARQHTIREVLRAWQAGAPVVYPVYADHHWHPPAIDAACLPAILAHDGSLGLKGALLPFDDRAVELELPDPGCAMDADTPQDYARMLEHLRRQKAPDDATVAAIWKYAGTPQRVIQHCQATAQLAVSLGQQLIDAGVPLNLDILRSGALLHDVQKLQKPHDAAGAAFLRDLGYEEMAVIAEQHMHPKAIATRPIDEAMVVCLADKRMQGTTDLGVEARFAKKRAKWQHDPEALASVERRRRKAIIAQRRIQYAIQRLTPEEIEMQERLHHYADLWAEQPDSPHACDPDHWDSRADSFATRSPEEYENPHVPAKYFVDTGMIHKDSRVLDIGCGPGGYSLLMAKGAAEVLGLDISPRMIRHAQAAATAQNIANASFEVANFCDIDVEERGWRGAFDMVFASFCPAVRNAQNLLKMCDVSRKWCYFGSYTARTSSIHDEIRRIFTGGSYALFSQQPLYYAFNILLAAGYFPQVQYRDNVWKRDNDVQSLVNFYSRMYAVTDPALLDQAQTALQAHADADGILHEELNSKVAWLYWDVTQR